MSFETQEGASTCGIASLRYALSLLGRGLRNNREVEENDIRRKIGKTAWKVFRDGTDEDEIARAAAKLGLESKFHHFRRRDPDRFLEELRKATAQQHPCIVSFHDDDENHFHWVCVAAFTDTDRVIVLDPATLDDDLDPRTYWMADTDGDFSPAHMGLARFRAWIDPAEDMLDELEPGEDAHFFIELWPQSQKREWFVPGMMDLQLLKQMRARPDLCEEFDQYIDDLRDIFGPPTSITEGRRASEFLEAQRDKLRQMIAGWTLREACPREEIEAQLDNLLALTRCYDFRVGVGREADVLVNLGFYLGWWAAECAYEVGAYEE